MYGTYSARARGARDPHTSTAQPKYTTKVTCPLCTTQRTHTARRRGDADALAALSDHTADTDGWDDEFLPGYASGASDDGDLF